MMVSFMFLTTFLGFYIVYNTSEKSIKNPSFGFEHWVERKKGASKLWALLLFLVSFAIFYSLFGFGSGTFFFVVTLMALGSLVLLLTPLKLIKPRQVV